MDLVFNFTARTSMRVAEVGFLLMLIAGLWLLAAQFPLFKFSTARTTVAGLALTAGGVLLVIAGIGVASANTRGVEAGYEGHPP